MKANKKDRAHAKLNMLPQRNVCLCPNLSKPMPPKKLPRPPRKETEIVNVKIKL